MNPPIAQIIAASSAVVALIGPSPIRFWSFGEAPRNADGTPASGAPYVVWQFAYGSPENYLGQTPDMDYTGVQVDTYATSAALCRQVAKAVQDALEQHAHVVSYGGEFRDEPTNLFRVSYTVEFWTER